MCLFVYGVEITDVPWVPRCLWFTPYSSFYATSYSKRVWNLAKRRILISDE